MSKRAIFLGGKRGAAAAGGGGGGGGGATTTTWQVEADVDDGWGVSDSSSTWTNDADNILIGFYRVGGWVPTGFFGFVRFTGVTIPQGATIDTAKLTLRSTSTSGGGAESESTDLDAQTFKVDALDADTTTTPTGPNDFNNTATSNCTTAIVDWSLSSSLADDADFDTPEIKTVLQEIVDRVGWSSGNAMTFRLYNAATASPGAEDQESLLSIQAHDLDPTKAAKLVVTYTPA